MKQDSALYDELLTEAQERFNSWRDHQPKRLSRYNPYDPTNNVVAVLRRPEAGLIIPFWFYGRNIVTNDGDIYYAKKGAGESPSTNENFLQARCELRTTSDTPAKTDTYGDVAGPITASRKTISATYPKTNDTGDADNTGDAVDAVSYSYSWTTGDFSDNDIEGGCLHDNASPVAGTKLLTHFSITQFAKTSSDTLKLFVNHTMNGV
jgi:hypothetical protein